jgi:transposase
VAASGRGAGRVEATTTAATREIRELKRRNAEREQTVEILKAATSFFVRESDPRLR